MFARERVYFLSAGLILLVVVVGAVYSEQFGVYASMAMTGLGRYFGWFYLLAVFLFVVFLLYLALGRYGKIRLGPQDSAPDFSFFSWVNMLLSAGFGVGLVFYGMAEPMLHYLEPPHGLAESRSPEASELAFQYSFFHWGLNQWAAFALVGLIIAFFQFRKERPGLVSNMVEPMLRGMKNPKPVLDGLDVLAVVATVMGIATSLGLGVLQINGGLNTVFGWPENLWTWIGILSVMFTVFMISSYTGLDRGIKILSNVNMTMVFALLAYMLLTGPTVYILNTFVNGLAGYFGNFIQMSLTLPPGEDGVWMSEYTLFYWAWVIAWSPFVGTFIARISRGRTIQEFVFGVLLVPPLLACVWIAIFGGYAMALETNLGLGLPERASDNVATALFAMYEALPFGTVLALVTMLVGFIFLVTSADSASYILSQMTDNGSLEPPAYKRLTWGFLISAVCVTLIAAGGLSGLQSASLIVALPFCFVLFVIMAVLLRELAADRREMLIALYHRNDATPVGGDIFETEEFSSLDVEERIKRRMVVRNPRLK